ncbi:MAG TPA: peptidase S15, partial [Actinophytocola sp.]
VVKDTGTIRFEDHGMEIGKRVLERYSWTADDVESVRGETSWTMTFARGDWAVRTVTYQVLTCTRTEFALHARLDAFAGERRVTSRNWDLTFPRDLV